MYISPDRNTDMLKQSGTRVLDQVVLIKKGSIEFLQPEFSQTITDLWEKIAASVWMRNDAVAAYLYRERKLADYVVKFQKSR